MNNQENSIDQHRRNDLYNVINDFYQMGGITEPVDVIGGLLINFFTTLDPHDTDDQNKPLLNYKAYNQDHVQRVVFTTVETIKFIVSLQETWRCYPDNPHPNF